MLWAADMAICMRCPPEISSPDRLPTVYEDKDQCFWQIHSAKPSAFLYVQRHPGTVHCMRFAFVADFMNCDPALSISPP